MRPLVYALACALLYVALAFHLAWARPAPETLPSVGAGAAAVALVCHWIRWSWTSRAEEARG